MKSVARQRNKMTLLLSGEFTDRVEAHNIVKVKFGIKPEKNKNKMNKKNLSFQFQLLHFPIKPALNLGLRWKTTSESPAPKIKKKYRWEI